MSSALVRRKLLVAALFCCSFSCQFFFSLSLAYILLRVLYSAYIFTSSLQQPATNNSSSVPFISVLPVLFSYVFFIQVTYYLFSLSHLFRIFLQFTYFFISSLSLLFRVLYSVCIPIFFIRARSSFSFFFFNVSLFPLFLTPLFFFFFYKSSS